jgi:hypothetical protein
VKTGGAREGQFLGRAKALEASGLSKSGSLIIFHILDYRRLLAQSKFSGVRSLAVKKSAH